MPASTFTPYYFADWVPGGAYHVYNRAVHRNRLFFANADHYKFVERLQRFVVPFADVYAYALVLNHFHLAIRLHDESSVHKWISSQRKPGTKAQAYLRSELAYGTLIGHLIGNAFKA